MPSRIKGITIEIGGNTSPLDKALEATTKKSVALNTEIKEINRALKFDPTNTTLLAQKQQTLSNAIRTTTEHLQTLRNAQSQVQAQFDKGEITEEQYRAFQREIVSTEQSLRTYTAEVKQAAIAQTQMSASAKAVYDRLDNIATVGLTTCLGALTAIATGATMAGKKLWEVASSAGDTADELDTTAQQTGLTTTKLQELQYATRFADAEMETLTKTMAKNIKSMQSAADGSANVVQAYQALGVEYLNADGTLRDGQTVYWEVIDALGNMSNATQRDAYAMQILGKSAQDINPIIKVGSAELKRLTDEADNLGVVLDEKTLGALQKFDDAGERVSAQASAFKLSLVAGMAEPLERINAAASKAFTGLQKSAGSGAIKASMEKLGESIEKVATKIISISEKAIPKLVNAFAWVVDNGGKLIAVTLSLTAAFATLKAALAIQKIIYAAIAAHAALKAAQVAGAAATGAATTAQLGFNAALMANPIGLVITGLAVLVAGLVTYAATCPKAQTETQKLSAELKGLQETTASSKAAHESSMTALVNEAVATSALINRLDVLTSKTTLTASEQAEMEAIIAKLNDSYDGLNLAYDAQAKALNKTISSIQDYTKAKYAEAKASQLTERAIELLDEQAQAEEQKKAADEALAAAQTHLTEVTNEYNEAIKNGADGRAVASQYGDTVLKATIAVEDATETAAGYQTQLDGVTQSITENDAALQSALESTGQYGAAADGAGAAAERFTWKNYDLQAVLDSTGLSADDAAAKLDSYASVTQNAFETIESTVNLTAAEMTKNLQANQQTMSQWASNMDLLANRSTSAGEKIDSGFIDTLREMGPEAAGTVANLATASQSDFDAFVSAWESGGDEAVQALLTEMGAGKTDIQDAGGQALQDAIDGVEGKQAELDTAVTKVITDSRTKAYEAVDAAQFRLVGWQITAGIAKGVRSGIGILKDAIDYIIDEALKEARKKSVINSPSGLFEDKVGFDLGRGVGVGIYDALGFINKMIDKTITSSTAYASSRVQTPSFAGATSAGPIIYFTQNIYSHDSLSESELNAAAEETIRRFASK